MKLLERYSFKSILLINNNMKIFSKDIIKIFIQKNYHQIKKICS